ncbi:protein boule-like isoform 2-T4 [Spinachia spinachia]
MLHLEAPHASEKATRPRDGKKNNTTTNNNNNNNNNSSSSSSRPEMLPPENDSSTQRCPSTASSRPGTVIPNRIFVGGIDFQVNESDLRHVFSQHGAVKEVKIVIDRTGMSKGYGFVTFETQDDALKILHDVNAISCKEKKLSIGPAVRRQHASAQTKSAHVTTIDCGAPRPVAWGPAPADAAYFCHNGVTYFHCPNTSPLPHRWPPAPAVALPGPHPPVYQHPAYHHLHHHQYQWNVVQAPMPQSPVVYSQQSEYPGPAQPPLPGMEDIAPEFVEPPALQVYPSYPPGAFVLQHDPRKNVMFPQAQRHPKAKYCQFIPHKDCYYLPEAAEPPEASTLCTHQPLM